MMIVVEIGLFSSKLILIIGKGVVFFGYFLIHFNKNILWKENNYKIMRSFSSTL